MTKHDFVTHDSVDALMVERDPSFIDYLFFHNVLDRFCWLLKLLVADRPTAKSRRYRLDLLFQALLLSNGARIEKAAKCISAQASTAQLEFHLMKGWHNELVRSDPLQPDYLKIGTQLSSTLPPGSGGTAAWNVVQSYYSVYEYVSCLSVAIDPSTDTRGHKSMARVFNNSLIGKGRDRVVFYPFSLASNTPQQHLPPHPTHCQFHYATYPRDRNLDVDKLESVTACAFQLIGENGRPTSLIDVLYELRLWASYTGVESLLRLSDGGYQSFLMKNLATIVFFYGGMAELAVLSALGERNYLAILKRFTKRYIDKNERFAGKKYLIPLYVRLRSFKHLGLISDSIDFIIPDVGDQISFISLENVKF